jgi:hypothetical membrane protein
MLNIRVIKFFLVLATLVPVIYFGSQLIAVPFFPNYNWLTVSASDLGSNRSSQPWILNAGALLTGAFAVLGAIGLGLSLPTVSVRQLLALVLAVCLVSTGLAAIWAGLHPLPHPKHSPGVIGMGMFATPFVAAMVAWQIQRPSPLRYWLLLNIGLFAGCAYVLSGSAGLDLQQSGGLFQKIVAAVSFFPGALIALATLRRLKE